MCCGLSKRDTRQRVGSGMRVGLLGGGKPLFHPILQAPLANQISETEWPPPTQLSAPNRCLISVCCNVYHFLLICLPVFSLFHPPPPKHPPSSPPAIPRCVTCPVCVSASPFSILPPPHNFISPSSKKKRKKVPNFLGTEPLWGGGNLSKKGNQANGTLSL